MTTRESDEFNIRTYALQQAVQFHASINNPPSASVEMLRSEIVGTAAAFREFLGWPPIRKPSTDADRIS
jgi:hypothetical protein